MDWMMFFLNGSPFCPCVLTGTHKDLQGNTIHITAASFSDQQLAVVTRTEKCSNEVEDCKLANIDVNNS